MSLRDYHHRLDMDATAGGRGAFAKDGFAGGRPDVSDTRLVRIAQWLSLVAAIAAVPAGIVVGAAMAASRDWASHGPIGRFEDLARSGGSIVVFGGLLAGIAIAVFVYAIARDLSAHPRFAGVAFLTVAAIDAGIGAVLLVAPGLVLGSGGNAAHRGVARLTDAELGGLVLLIAAVSATIAGVLALVIARRLRRAEGAA